MIQSIEKELSLNMVRLIENFGEKHFIRDVVHLLDGAPISIMRVDRLELLSTK